MEMEINEMRNAAGIYQNTLEGMRNAGKTVETKGTDSQDPKTVGQSEGMPPRHDKVEISTAGKAASALIQTQKDTAGAMQQPDTERKGKADTTMRQGHVEKGIDAEKTVLTNEIENHESAGDKAPQSDVESQKATGNAVHPAKSEKFSSDKENEDPTDDLSSLTDTELKQVYLKGDITKTEYDDELADRGIVESE